MREQPRPSTPTETGAVVEAIDLRKRFEGHEVLRGVSFNARRGETLVIMGGSGSGKTVTLRLVAGLIRPSSGRVRVFDHWIEGLGEEALLPIRRRMGYVFQGAALFDSLTVHENVAYPLREHTSLREAADPRPRRAVPVHWSGSAPRCSSCCRRELSGGMRKRVGIARALIGEPAMLLFDEPTAGLDPTNSRLVAELIVRLRGGVCDTADRGDPRPGADANRGRPRGRPDRRTVRGAGAARRGAGFRPSRCPGVPGRRGEVTW